MRYFANATAQKSRPAFPDGLGCSEKGTLLHGNELPVYRILCVNGIGCIGQKHDIALGQRRQIGDGDIAGDGGTLLQVGLTQGVINNQIGADVLLHGLTIRTGECDFEVAGIDGQRIGAAIGDLQGDI